MSGLSMSEISAIMKLIDGSDFDSIKLEMGDLKLELNRSGPVATPPVATQADSQPNPAPAEEVPAPDNSTGCGSDVPAPLLGTFYYAPKPGADPFVAVGDTITEHSIIGIIEVMKLMNSVTAGVAGVVAEIVAPNGELVEHGQVLIRVQPA